MDVLWSKDKLYKIFSKDSLSMTINAHASGDGCVTMKCCRLCGGDTSLRGFNETYVCDGVEERYDHLLYDCFGVKVYPSDCLICDHCVRQLRNIDRFRTLVHTAFMKQRSEYSSKHSQMGLGEGYSVPHNERKDTTCHTKLINYTRSKEAVKMRKRPKPSDVPKRKELKRDRRSMMSTNIAVKRMNIACMMCKQRYPMIIPFEGWKEFVCSRCKKNRDGKGDRRSSLKMASSLMRERLALSSKADLRGRSRLCCLPKKSTHLSKTEDTTRIRQQKYQCNLCPKKYVVAQHLAHHMSTVHGTKTDGKNFTCNVCNKDLKSKESLEKHTRMHTGQPVYQCDVCLRSFKGKRTFQAHYLTHGK